MLHELVHNVQGPHNAVFYKLLDEITEVSAVVSNMSSLQTLLLLCPGILHTTGACKIQQQHGAVYRWVSLQ